MKRHHDHNNSYKGKHLIGWLTISELQSIILVGHGSTQVDTEKELKFLHLDLQAKGIELSVRVSLIRGGL